MNPEHEQQSQETLEPKGISNRRMSRRAFLRGARDVGIGTAALATVGVGRDALERDLLPHDILSSEELLKRGIKINQSPTTKLHLRPEVFKFDVFKDARDRKIDGLEITLVDHDSLSWNAMGKLDDAFLRTLGQAISVDPEHFVERKYDEFRQGQEGKLAEVERSYRQNLEDLRMLETGELAGQIEKNIDTIENQVLPRITAALMKKPYETQIEQLRERLTRIEDGTERNGLTEAIEDELTDIERIKGILEQTSDRESAVDYFADNAHTYGLILRTPRKYEPSDEERFSDRQRELWNKLDSIKPGWREKVYIFTSVGGKFTPTPNESHPQTNWYDPRSVNFLESLSPESYIVDTDFEKGGASFILRHEVGHYKPGISLPEKLADKAALASIAEASRRYQEDGDSSGYMFVFENKHGITYATRESSERADL